MARHPASLANLDRASPYAAMRHGVTNRNGTLARCARCPTRSTCAEYREGAECGIEVEYIPQRRRELLSVPHIAPVDCAAVEQLLWVELRLARAQRALAAEGEYVTGADGLQSPSRVGQEVGRLSAQWARLAKHLGIGPTERRLLGGAEQASAVLSVLQEISGGDTP